MNINKNHIPATSDYLACHSNIAIRVNNGIAVLSGWACSDEQKLQAEKAVNFMPGVERVYNMVKTNRD